MFLLANLIEALAVVIQYGLMIYMWIIVIRALISWVNPDPYNPIVQFLYSATEPVLTKIRSKLPPTGGMDLSPIVALMLILFLQVFLVKSLHQIAYKINYYEKNKSSIEQPF